MLCSTLFISRCHSLLTHCFVTRLMGTLIFAQKFPRNLFSTPLSNPEYLFNYSFSLLSRSMPLFRFEIYYAFIIHQISESLKLCFSPRAKSDFSRLATVDTLKGNVDPDDNLYTTRALENLLKEEKRYFGTMWILWMIPVREFSKAMPNSFIKLEGKQLRNENNVLGKGLEVTQGNKTTCFLLVSWSAHDRNCEGILVLFCWHE